MGKPEYSEAACLFSKMNRMRRLLPLIGLAVLFIAGCGNFFTDEDDSGNPSTARFVFVTNFSNGGLGTVSVFLQSTDTGALTLQSTASTGSTTLATGPEGIVTVLGKFLYTANNGGGVSAFTINSSTGALNGIAGSPFASGNLPRALSATPDGKFLYVANSADNSLTAFAINSGSGVLSVVNGFPVALTSAPTDVEVDPLGRFVYVAMPATGITAFKLNTDGTLTGRLDVTPPLGGKPTGLVVEKTGRFLYAADGAQGVESYSINATTGALTALSPATTNVGTNPVAVAVDPSGVVLAVANHDSDNISTFAILANGTLAGGSGSPFNAASHPQALGFDPTGKYLYVANFDATVTIYSLDSATPGKLTAAGTASAVTNPSGIAFK